MQLVKLSKSATRNAKYEVHILLYYSKNLEISHFVFI